jgi:hypothetical protein
MAFVMTDAHDDIDDCEADMILVMPVAPMT